MSLLLSSCLLQCCYGTCAGCLLCPVDIVLLGILVLKFGVVLISKEKESKLTNRLLFF